jgi:integrase
MSQHVTSYTARHSFATVLKRSGASIELISESLGHTNKQTTQNYLADFETDVKRKWAAELERF